MKRCSFSLLQTHLLSVVSLFLSVICYAVIIIRLSVVWFIDTMFIDIRTGICWLVPLCYLYMYVILQVVRGLHVFLHIFVEYTRCGKYKCRKIQKIWVVGG